MRAHNVLWKLVLRGPKRSEDPVDVRIAPTEWHSPVPRDMNPSGPKDPLRVKTKTPRL